MIIKSFTAGLNETGKLPGEFEWASIATSPISDEIIPSVN
jgi:hypothetical protein